jgi:murein DD-endopeptidase MepM/ murein hydrolase activator NlpD
MKPYRLILPLLLATSALVPVVGAVASNQSFKSLDPEGLQVLDQVAVEPAPSLPPSSGDILIAQELEIPRRPSLPPPPPPTTTVSTVVRLGDTLLKIAQRYGLTMGELLQLNPGLETARLVVGSQVQVVRSAPGRSRMLLGLAPVGSGGLSWPELPSFGNDQRQSAPYLRGSSALTWPAQGTFTSGYGWRWGRMHKGIDIANNVGTPIVAAARGRVSFAGWHEGGYGYFVEITHDDGSRTRYGHNSNLLVREGQLVDQGQVISQMGSTGRSTGPHLHFEVLPPGEGAMNPLQFLPPRA